MQTDQSYICDICETEFLFTDADDQVVHPSTGETYYLFHNWHGCYDGQDMCEACWDSY